MNILRQPDPYTKVGQVNNLAPLNPPKGGKANSPSFGGGRGEADLVWALKDINFEVKQGEVLGIIGKNGAGKSTLLKILSKVTSPTTGSIKVKGRIASLLEVGTGFNPEMTGRENIYMNGTIMGMRKWKINKKFDEIIDFSGVEKYIDTPVKRYSSGMSVRLGFAVAAHLEPEILVVDEVLAVGDAEFQKKAIGKMQDVSQGQGRTVLFVSHNMAAVKSLCNSAILLQNGTIFFEGTQLQVINKYLSLNKSQTAYQAIGSMEQWLGNNNIRIKSFTLQPKEGDVLSISSGLIFQIVFYNYKQYINLDTTFELSTFDEIVVFHQGELITTENNSKEGLYTVTGEIPSFFLNAGSYKLKVIFGENQRYALFVKDDIISFEILNEVAGSNHSVLPGVVRGNIKYKVSFAE